MALCIRSVIIITTPYTLNVDRTSTYQTWIGLARQTEVAFLHFLASAHNHKVDGLVKHFRLINSEGEVDVQRSDAGCCRSDNRIDTQLMAAIAAYPLASSVQSPPTTEELDAASSASAIKATFELRHTAMISRMTIVRDPCMVFINDFSMKPHPSDV